MKMSFPMRMSFPRKRESRLLVAAAAILLASCGGSPVKENFYTLSGPQAPMPAASANPRSIFVGPVTVPESVDRLPMVLRTAANQVEISDAHRWAEPLKASIPRVLAETLMREMATPNVRYTRAGSPLDADFRVAVEVQRFESSLTQGATVDALWTVTPRQGTPRSGRSTVSEPPASADPGGVAAAHSRALERVGREIAAAMK
ncbi:MAG TPA: PqiC family protein [Usitatibacter sp.]|nr:PqiC family protein [Usitatibacter sp.]